MTIPVELLHTTRLGELRIRRNVGPEIGDVVAWCRECVAASSPHDIMRRGKNWYVRARGCVNTNNAHSYTIITAHRV